MVFGVGGDIVLMFIEVEYGSIDVLGFWVNGVFYFFDVLGIFEEVWE